MLQRQAPIWTALTLLAAGGIIYWLQRPGNIRLSAAFAPECWDE